MSFKYLSENPFKPSIHWQGIRPIQIYMLKLFFLLMFLIPSREAYSVLIYKSSILTPEEAVAWSAIASYTTLAGIGVFRTIKMLPLMLFMLLYKFLWLSLFAYPALQENNFYGTKTEGWTQSFIIMIVPLLFFPYKFFFKRYILNSD